MKKARGTPRLEGLDGYVHELTFYLVLISEVQAVAC